MRSEALKPPAAFPAGMRPEMGGNRGGLVAVDTPRYGMNSLRRWNGALVDTHGMGCLVWHGNGWHVQPLPGMP
jgi:hypothetical protein